MLLWLETIFQDAHFGLRMLRKNPVVTVAAVLSLSLAIGACAAAFTLIDALYHRPLPVRDPSGLFYLEYSYTPSAQRFFMREFFDRLVEVSRDRADLFGFGLGGFQPAIFDDSSGVEERLQVQVLSGDAFRILGVSPAVGRVLAAADDGHRVAVLSHSLWTRRFRSNPAVVGRWFNFRGAAFQIVGVAQKTLTGLLPGYRTDLFIANTDLRGWEFVWGHLKPGVTREQARQILQATFTNYLREHPEQAREYLEPGQPLGRLLDARLELRNAPADLPTGLRVEWQRPLWILAGIAGLVLLIACSNVANLLIARAATREREMAMRISIGAGRLRIIQQLLVESSLLGGTACILGLMFAYAATPFIFDLMTPSRHAAVYEDIHLDLRILPFLIMIGIGTTVLFGLAPAMRASSVSPQKALKTGSGNQSGRMGILRLLLASQIGFSFIVLFIGGLLLISLQKLTRVDLGFAKDNVLLVDLYRGVGAQDSRGTALQLLERIRQLPAVQAASMSNRGLFDVDRGRITAHIQLPGREPESSETSYLAVAPAFFDTMQIPILEGRDLAAGDFAPGSTAVVINQAFAVRYFPGENALGKRFEKIGNGPRHDRQEIVGIVRDAKYDNHREPNLPIVYEPIRSINGTVEVRTAADPLLLAPAIRREIQRSNPTLRIANVLPQSIQIENSLFRERLLTLLAGFFAVLAIVLAGIGLYGVLSYSVVRRTKEIGIRVALGARRLGVVRLVIADIMLMVAFGVAAGIAGGLALARFVATLLFEVKPSDFWSLALPLVCLMSGVALAAVPPAFRIARVDASEALRQE